MEVGWAGAQSLVLHLVLQRLNWHSVLHNISLLSRNSTNSLVWQNYKQHRIRSVTSNQRHTLTIQAWLPKMLSYARWPRWSRLPASRLILSLVILIPPLIFLLRPSTFELLFHNNPAPSIILSNLQQPQPPFPPPEHIPYRAADLTDAFAAYRNRNTCNISSRHLHSSFSPLCHTREDLLTAMSNGGRIGFDAPFMPRSCDMRWFTTQEVCDILARFEKVVLVGDSMLRHVIGAINVLLRQDLGYGAVTDWNFSTQEKQDCFCNEQFDVKDCSVQGIYKTSDVEKHDPESLACPHGSINVQIEQINGFPIPASEKERLILSVTSRTHKPIAFILGHGLWSDLSLAKSLRWLDSVLETIAQHHTHSNPPLLFMTPNAAGKEKPDAWLKTQGNKHIMVYEEAMRDRISISHTDGTRPKVEFLGTWNMSIQATKYDGVHMDMRGNLVKAMMVMNWLSMLEIR